MVGDRKINVVWKRDEGYEINVHVLCNRDGILENQHYVEKGQGI